MRILLKIGVGLLASLLVSGCNLFVSGHSRPACAGDPGNPLCVSASESVALTDTLHSFDASDAAKADDLRRRRDRREASASGGRGDVDCSGEECVREVSRVQRLVSSSQTIYGLNVANDLAAQSGGVPLLMPAEVMRVWVAPYVSDDGDLHMAGLFFVEVSKRRWVLGQETAPPRARVRPYLTSDDQDARPVTYRQN